MSIFNIIIHFFKWVNSDSALIHTFSRQTTGDFVTLGNALMGLMNRERGQMYSCPPAEQRGLR